MKKYLIIICIIAAFFAYKKIKDWYDTNQVEKAKLFQENLNLKKTIIEDSLTISSQTMVIYDSKSLIQTKSKKITDLEKKYNSTMDSYFMLKTKFDSLSTDHDTIHVKDIDTLTATFDETLGGGWFGVYGKVNKNPLYIYGMGLYQIKPIIIEISLEKLPNKEYVTYTHVNYPDLEISIVPVKIVDKRRWIDKISFVASVSTIKFGAGVGLIYDKYGITYMQFTDNPALQFNYVNNLGEIF